MKRTFCDSCEKEIIKPSTDITCDDLRVTGIPWLFYVEIKVEAIRTQPDIVEPDVCDRCKMDALIGRLMRAKEAIRDV